jgi:hypothetical protein
MLKTSQIYKIITKVTNSGGQNTTQKMMVEQYYHTLHKGGELRCPGRGSNTTTPFIKGMNSGTPEEWAILPNPS